MSNKVIGIDQDEENLVRNQWKAFSETLAFRKMMEYADTNREMLLRDAEDLAISVEGKRVPIDSERSNLLLQNRRGIGIMTTYIRVYTE